MKWTVRLLFIALMCAEILAWNGIILHLKPDYSWLGLAATAILVLGIIEIIQLSATLRLLVFLDTMLDACSDMFHFYSRIHHWDKLLHFLGGATVAIVAIWLLEKLVREGKLYVEHATVGIIIGAILIVAFCGTLYETEEWLTDVHYLHYQKQLGDGPDTVTDEIWNEVGALSAALAWSGFLALRGSSIYNKGIYAEA